MLGQQLVSAFVHPRIGRIVPSVMPAQFTRFHLYSGSRIQSKWATTSKTRTVTNGLGHHPKNVVSNENEYGTNMDQEDLMESDMLVAVDEYDNLISDFSSHGSSYLSKRAGHTFNVDTPRAALHRAFSFFLFDSDNRLLLTQRASSKITFPNVWTNTVCSHPLYGMSPNEVDIVPDAYPSFPGIKHAAIRKCKHELGIDKQYIPHESIQFITRYHYWAADTITYGVNSPWGEHEVDYILFLRTNQSIPIHPAADEVSDYRFVTIDQLKEMLQQPDLIWSPWFLGIMERGGWDYWADLDGSLDGKNTNEEVTFFEPPAEHVASYNLQSHTRQTGVLAPVSSIQ